MVALPAALRSALPRVNLCLRISIRCNMQLFDNNVLHDRHFIVACNIYLHGVKTRLVCRNLAQSELQLLDVTIIVIITIITIIMMQGRFQYGEDSGLPAGHESLKCLSSAMPRWIGDAYWDNKVRHVLHTKSQTRPEEPYSQDKWGEGGGC